MNTSFQKDFDTLFNNMLTDWQNQFPEADISQGSLIFIKTACLSSALWGLYKYQDYIAKQIFSDTSDLQNFEHHAAIRNITRKTGESESDWLSRYLADIRNPPAGGNKNDYIKWALEVTDVKAAHSYDLAMGLGTVDVVIIADEVSTGSEIPNQTLINTTLAYIEALRPAGLKNNGIRVLAPTILNQDVTMTVSPSTVDTSQIDADIQAYMQNLDPDQTFYIAQLISIALAAGAGNANVTVPASDVTPAAYEMIRAGTINVTAP